MWGISIKTKEILELKAGRGLQFGVVTLKEMNGVNRIDDFIKLCMLRGWILNRIDVHNQVDSMLGRKKRLSLNNRILLLPVENRSSNVTASWVVCSNYITASLRICRKTKEKSYKNFVAIT